MLNLKKVIALLAILGTVLEPIGKVSQNGDRSRFGSRTVPDFLLAAGSRFEGGVNESDLLEEALEDMLAEGEVEEGEEEEMQVSGKPLIYEIGMSDLIDDGAIVDLAKKNKFNTISIRGGLVAGEGVTSEVRVFCEQARRAGIRVVLYLSDEKKVLSESESLKGVMESAMAVCDGVIFDDPIIRRFDMPVWKEWIAECKKSKPEFSFIAQLEFQELDESTNGRDLQRTGFDYIYDTRPYELLALKDDPQALRGWLKSSWRGVEQSRTIHFIHPPEDVKSENGLSTDDEKLFAAIAGLLPGGFIVRAEKFEAKGLRLFYKYLAEIKSDAPFQEGSLYVYDAYDAGTPPIEFPNENIVAYSTGVGLKHGLVVANVSGRAKFLKGTLRLKGHKPEGADSYANPLGLDANKYYILRDEVSGEEERLKGSELMDHEITLKPKEVRIYTLEKEAEPVPIGHATKALKEYLRHLKVMADGLRAQVLAIKRLADEGAPRDEVMRNVTHIAEEWKGLMAFADGIKEIRVQAGSFDILRGELEEDVLSSMRLLKADRVFIDFGEGGYFSLGFSESGFLNFAEHEKRFSKRTKGKAIAVELGGCIIYVCRDKQSLKELGAFSEDDTRRLLQFWKEREEGLILISEDAKGRRKGFHEFFSRLDHDLLRTSIGMTYQAFMWIGEKPEMKGNIFEYVINEDTPGIIEAFLEILEGEVKYEAFDIAELVREVASGCMPLAREKSIAFKMDFTGEALEVFGSRNQLRRVFVNLISNAVKYTKAGSVSIAVSASRDRKSAIIKIVDTGIGIPQADQEKVFRGTRASNVGDIPGTGFGLRIVKEIIEMHANGSRRGRISVSSKEGKGTTFKATIPLKKEIEPFQMGGNFVLSDAEIQGVSKIKLPSGEKVAVIEHKRHDADYSAGNLLDALRKRKNSIRRFAVGDSDVDSVKSALEEFQPNVVLVPYGEEALEEMLEDASLDSDGGVSVYFYESPNAPFEHNLIQPYSDLTVQLKEGAIRQHASQVGRLQLDRIADFFAKANGCKATALGIRPRDGGHIEHAEFHKITSIKNGNIAPIDTTRRFVFGNDKFDGLENLSFQRGTPAIFISPHPDDCEISAAALVRALLISGADVSNWIMTSGVGAYIPEIDDRDDLIYEEKKRLKTEMRRCEAIAAASVLGMLREPQFLDPQDIAREGVVLEMFRASLKAQFDSGQRDFIVILPDENDSHPRHRLATKLVLDALTQLTKEMPIEVRLVFYDTPWSGEFNAFYYSKLDVFPTAEIKHAFSEAQHRKLAVGLIGGELLAGFGKRAKTPQELGGPYAERFLMRRIAAGSS